MKSVKKKVNTLLCQQFVPRPIDEVFPFFADEKNLEVITPPWLNFKVVGMSTPQMGTGTLIDYKLAVHGIPLRWQSIIEDWTTNQKFVDRQTVGPYAYWHHTHTFEPSPGGTLMTDVVEYRVPGGVVGQLLGGWFVRRDLEKIFAFRQKKIEALFPKS